MTIGAGRALSAFSVASALRSMPGYIGTWLPLACLSPHIGTLGDGIATNPAVVRSIRVKPAFCRALVSAPLLALVLAGCSVQEQTQRWYPRDNGVSAQAGDIGLRNILVVTSSDGQATLLTTFANEGADDELVEVHIGDAIATPSAGPLEIPAGGYASLEPSGDQLGISGAELTPGQMTEVEFRFAKAPRTAVQALVMANEGAYSQVTFPDQPPVDDEANG